MDLNQQFDKRYLLALESEDKLQESLAGLIKEHLEGNIPSDLFAKSLDIGSYTIQEIYKQRKRLHALIKQIRYHLVRMEEYIEANYEDGMEFVVVPNQIYVKLHQDFLHRSNQFLKEWEQYNKEHGLCIPYIKSRNDTFKLVFEMINLLTDEYGTHIHPDEELRHIYLLARELPRLLMDARDLALGMEPQIIADQYYMRKYLGKSIFTRFNPGLQQHTHNDYEFKQARANNYPDFEYVREPGMPINTGFENNFGMERRRHIDLVPESQMHQLMTGEIGQLQYNQFNETKHFKSRLFEAGLGLHAYPPIKRHPLQTTGQMGETSDNINPYPHLHHHQESHSEEPSAATPPGPKLERPNTRCTSPNYTFVRPTVNSDTGRQPRSERPTTENASGRMTRSGSGRPVCPGLPKLRQEPSQEITRKS